MAELSPVTFKLIVSQLTLYICVSIGSEGQTAKSEIPQFGTVELLVKRTETTSNQQGCNCGCIPLKCKCYSHKLVSPTKFLAVNIKDIESLDKKQKEDLNMKLGMETKDLIFAFHELLTSFCDSLEKQQIPIKRLRTYLMAIEAVVDTEDQSASQKSSQLVNSAKDTDDVIGVIRKYSSFFDFKLVEYMINCSGTENDKKRFHLYEHRFLTYLSHRICECSKLSVQSPHGDDYVELMIKLDSRYESKQLSSIKELEVRLSQTLIVNTCLLNLCSIERGCIKLIFQIPFFVQEMVFPLSTVQENSLTEMGIIQLTCGQYEFPQRHYLHQVLMHLSIGHKN